MLRDPFTAPHDASGSPDLMAWEAAASHSRARAHHVRQMACALPTGLQPLGVAMRRRACELELADMALSAMVEGRRVQRAST